ncbi:recombinase family protein [Anaerotruncus rubiinfantis]|jgi:site-specific DNA recombinase|uniref:recombinase family protein n=1 Tax=Anaerotruncus rubiinfantis TaxID=1720200 RepID=UPI001A9A80E0|nr:recombinase family protein [Anaerotruncus rubiinfantis]
MSVRIAVYSRKSVWTGKGESIENQVEMCRQYIESRIEGGKEAEVFIYEDEGFSGKNLDRPQFQKLLADSKKQKFNYIVCYRLDRISRSVGDFAPLVEDLIARGIGLVCIKEQFDTATPMGKAMMYVASVFAQLERETIAERVRDNMMLLARSGRWLGGTPPTGFLSERVGEAVLEGKVKTSCKLKPNPAEIGVVRLMFQKYLELRSLTGVSKFLIQKGIRNRSLAPYSVPGIKDILRNPVYCIADRDARDYFISSGSDVCFPETECSETRGLLSYNKRSYSRKTVSRLDKSQWIIAVGRHRGIVCGADWVKVQRLLKEKAEHNPQKPPQSFNGYSLLSGQIFCAKCGSRMFAKKRSNSDLLFDYICGSKLRSGNLCRCQNLGGQQADGLVCDYLLGFAHGDTGILDLLDDLQRKFQNGDSQAPVQFLDALIEKTCREMDSLVAALVSAGASEPLVRRVSARMEQLNAELDRMEEEKKRLEAAQNSGKPSLAELSAALANFPDCFAQMTIHEKRDFVRLFVEKLVWDGMDLHIYLYGDPPRGAGEITKQKVSVSREWHSQR